MGKTLEFAITNDEFARALIDSVIADLQRLPRIKNMQNKVENLKEIKTTVDELITFYKNN